MNPFFEIENIPSKPKLLAWSADENNKISIVEIETQQEFANFDGVKLKKGSIFLPFISDSIRSQYIKSPTILT